jgi:hypothetical protein
MAESENSQAHIPSGLLYDHRLDPESAVRKRIKERVGPGEDVRLVVHMKNGATYVGALTYFDCETLSLTTTRGPVDLANSQVAHIIKVPADVI